MKKTFLIVHDVAKSTYSDKDLQKIIEDRFSNLYPNPEIVNFLTSVKIWVVKSYLSLDVSLENLSKILSDLPVNVSKSDVPFTQDLKC